MYKITATKSKSRRLKTFLNAWKSSGKFSSERVNRNEMGWDSMWSQNTSTLRILVLFAGFQKQKNWLDTDGGWRLSTLCLRASSNYTVNVN